MAETQEKRRKEKYTVIKEDCGSFDIMSLREAEKQNKRIVLNPNIDLFIASFSGGKDSQVLLDLVSRVIPASDFSVTYSDTGYEIPPSLEIYERTKKEYRERFPDLQFYLSKNHQNVLYYWDKMGSPSRIHRWCCGVMKTAPLYRKLKEIHNIGRQPNVLAFEGVRAEESGRRLLYNRIAAGVKHNNVVNVRPIFEWNTTEIYLYLLTRRLPINEGYRNGLRRAGCSICPFSSGWSEYVIAKKYSDKINPFVSKILERTSLLGIGNEDAKKEYVKLGKWKTRAGGKTSYTENSRLDIISTEPCFEAILTDPKENFITWMKVLGKIKMTQMEDSTRGELSYDKELYSFSLRQTDGKKVIVFFENMGNKKLTRDIKRVLYKTAYCVHCETCEVECATGALSVVPSVSVDSKKCIHCHRCVNFKQRGCVVANSINIPERSRRLEVQISERNNNKNNSKMRTSIDRYSTFGMREKWVSDFFNSPDDYFKENNLGSKMIPACVNWFREAEILSAKSGEKKEISEIGNILKKIFDKDRTIVWEIMWVNLAYNSEIVKFYTSNIDFHRDYSKREILELMKSAFGNKYSDSTLTNPLGALCNMFGIKEQSIIGDTMKQGIIVAKGNAVETISREPYNDISSFTVAYALYRYAESKKRYALTVSEFYDDEQTEGIYRQFGLRKEYFEKFLRTLKENKTCILNADLNCGLDNIRLREDLTLIDVLKLI